MDCTLLPSMHTIRSRSGSNCPFCFYRPSLSSPSLIYMPLQRAQLYPSRPSLLIPFCTHRLFSPLRTGRRETVVVDTGRGGAALSGLVSDTLEEDLLVAIAGVVVVDLGGTGLHTGQDCVKGTQTILVGRAAGVRKGDDSLVPTLSACILATRQARYTRKRACLVGE